MNRICYLLTVVLSAAAALAAAQEPAPKPQAPVQPQTPVGADPRVPKLDGHWGEEAVGFRWVEGDSRDSRWNQTDVGPFLASSLPTPTGVVAKALSIRLGVRGQASVCYDLETMSWRCAWTGGFLQFDPARFGIIRTPAIQGQVAFAAPAGPSWLDAKNVDYRGLHVHGQRVVLVYDVDGVRVLDAPWLVAREGQASVIRTLHVGPGEPLATVLASAETPLALMHSEGQAALRQVNGRWEAQFADRDQPATITIQVALPSGEDPSNPLSPAPSPGGDPADAGEESQPILDLEQLTRPGPGRWGEPLRTSGRRAADTDAYVVDTIDLPFDNPYRALLFLGGHDFFSTPGRAAVCTMHGDVWLVEGLDDDLQEITWTRFATGLYQALGLKIVNDQVYVLGRDQITRLHDVDGDGEADYYESFNHGARTSPGGHDYSACLETDPDGNFYYISHQGVHRISSDGKRYQTMATGLRNPNGMGVGPDGTITAAPQEGEWTPASAIYEVTEGGYYGYGGPVVTDQRSRGYDPPLCWLPRLVDNSTGGQVWVPEGTWGPLAGQLLTLSYGQCRVLLTLLEPAEQRLPAAWPLLGDRRTVTTPPGVVAPGARYVQGAALVLPMAFESGIMRGRFSPHDGQLYVSGLRGWVSAAVRDGCLQRVRYTGLPARLPLAIRTLANGVALTFSTPLDSETAENPGSYRVQQWNYRYRADYGSQDWRVSDSSQPGRDEVRVLSATLLDERTVFLELPDLQPVMQMSIEYSVVAADRRTLHDTLYHTVNCVPELRMDPTRLTRRPAVSGLSQQREDSLQPGLHWSLLSEPLGDSAPSVDGPPSETVRDARLSRMAALLVPAGEPPSPWISPGTWTAVGSGFLQVPLRGSYTFAVAGRGAVRLRVNDREVLVGHEQDLTTVPRRTVPLNKGFNRLELWYQPEPGQEAAVRLLWASDSFPLESVPPTQLFHLPDDPELQRAARLRAGRGRFAQLRCHRCHLDQDQLGPSPMPELLADAPDLRHTADRLQPAWIAQWLLEPRSVRNRTTMPHVLDATDPTSRQAAADLASFLTTAAAVDPSAPLSSPGVANPASSSSALPPPAATEPESLVDQGEAYFEQLGCLACHGFSLPTEPDPYDRVSLALVNSKYAPQSLLQFLLRPHEHYRYSRMPDFRLSDDEARALAAYLASRASGQLADWTRQLQGDPARGAARFRDLGCARCHDGPLVAGVQPLPVPRLGDKKATPLRSRAVSADLAGCIASERPSDHRGPWYVLSGAQRQELQEFVASGLDSLTRRSLAESAERLMEHLSCRACHDRDARRSILPQAIVEFGSGKVPDPFPALTWAGEKLNAEWTQRFLSGETHGPLRPWLTARMPAFPAYAESLAVGLAHGHGWNGKSAAKPAWESKQAEWGRQLTLETGLDCRQCHGIGPLQPRGDERTRIAFGINFAQTRERLTYDYYRRFVLDPPRYDVGSKMPKLSPDGTTTKVERILDGNAASQFDAIWQYLHHFERVPD